MGFILKLLNIFFAVFLINLPVFGATISGNVRQDEILNNKNVVVDSMTEKPVKGADIFVPNYNIQTKTDSLGRFELNADITD